jgi:hypothetical protein
MCVNDSAIHETTIVNTGRKDRKTNMEIKFWEIPFRVELLDILHAVSAVWGSGA